MINDNSTWVGKILNACHKDIISKIDSSIIIKVAGERDLRASYYSGSQCSNPVHHTDGPRIRLS